MQTCCLPRTPAACLYMPFVHLLTCEGAHGSSHDLRRRTISRLSTGPGSGFVVRNVCERQDTTPSRSANDHGLMTTTEAVLRYAKRTSMLRPRDLLLFSDESVVFNQPLTAGGLIERFDAVRGQRRIVFSAEAWYTPPSKSQRAKSATASCPDTVLHGYRELWNAKNRSAELSGSPFPREGHPFYCPRCGHGTGGAIPQFHLLLTRRGSCFCIICGNSVRLLACATGSSTRVRSWATRPTSKRWQRSGVSLSYGRAGAVRTPTLSNALQHASC